MRKRKRGGAGMQTAKRAGVSQPRTQVQGAGPEAGVGGSPAAWCPAGLAGGCTLRMPESLSAGFQGSQRQQGESLTSQLSLVLSPCVPHPLSPPEEEQVPKD